MDFNKEIKSLQFLVTQLKGLQKPKSRLNDYQLALKLSKAETAAKSVPLPELIDSIEEHLRQINEKIKISMEERREKLLICANESNFTYKRFGDYDRITFFKISYKGKRVKFEIGSELVCQFDETDGNKIFEILKQEYDKLRNTYFEREGFFQTVKDAYKIAINRENIRNSWVPIRTLYVYISLLRNLQFNDYLKKPNPKSIREYSLAQFVFDLARFGEKGWSIGDEVLQTQTPNMATTAAGKTVTLPDLKSVTMLGPQLAVLRISKRGK